MKTFKFLFLFLNLSLISSVENQSIYALARWEKVQEMVSMLYAENIQRYDCSKKTEMEWHQTGEKSKRWALYYISTGVLFEFLGLAVLLVLVVKIKMNHGLRVYKLMSFIAFVGVTEIYGNSIWPGVSVLLGTVYCTSQFFTTFFGKLTMIQWILGSSSAVYLGFHRIIDLTQKGKWLVNSNLKTNISLAILTLYSIYGSIFFDTVLYNSVMKSPWLNPMTGLGDSEYSNYFLRFHNIFSSIFLVLIYSSLFIIWRMRENQVSSKYVTNFQKSILIQSVCISCTYAIPGSAFVSMYLVGNPPSWYLTLCDLTYQLSGGAPFFMYLALNRQIRIEVCKYFGIFKSYTNKYSSVVSIPKSNSTLLVV